MMRGWWSTTDSFAIYQCNVSTIILDYNLWNSGKITCGYPILWNNSWQLSSSDNYYITYYQYKNLTSINNNILSISSLKSWEASQYYVLNFNGINFQWWLLSDDNLNWISQSKITNLSSDLITINWNIWILQNYFLSDKLKLNNFTNNGNNYSIL